MSDQPAEGSDTEQTEVPTPGQDSPPEPGPYRVLARKYRPARFADLIGQEAAVRALSNAIRGGRVAHAFILTGVRGVGKTTTARIIARALNCIGPDGEGGPTPDPCGRCEHCLAIAEDRHVDVIEMDAASRTGIDDIRELIEGVRYRPVSARNKVYIIDEVHMLSRQAFNGLLKTLEEPPEHVVFIFATTEIRKLPVTVLSRCQRFDLRRVEQAVLAEHFGRICEQEGVTASEPALAMIARAADGSVRDGLSLLDQAIALSAAPDDAEGGQIQVDDAQVKAMLGLSDRTRIFDLFEAVMGGAMAEALEVLAELHAAGADPATLLQDLLELTHFLTRAKLVPSMLEDPATPEAERRRGRALAERLAMAELARCWQMLLKGLGEVRFAPAPLQAAEMVLIRLAHAAGLPSPAELVKRLEGGDGGTAASAPRATPRATSTPAGDPPPPAVEARTQVETAVVAPAGPQAALAMPMEEEPAPAPLPQPRSFEEVVALARRAGEALFANHLARDVHLVRFEPGRIELRLGEHAPKRLANQLGELMETWTGQRWVVSLSQDSGAAPLRVQEEAEEARKRTALLDDPLVKAVLETFPEAEIVARRDAPQRDEAAEETPSIEPPEGERAG